MITFPLLSNARHRAIITPVSPLLTRLIYISPSCWTIFYSFEITLEMGLDFKSSVLCKSIASKNIQSDINYVLKNTFCVVRQLGL